MRIKLQILAILVCLMTACAGYAQRGQRGGRRNNFNITSLVFRTDVQTDLALTADEKSKLDALRSELRPQRVQGATPPTPEERRARAEEAQKKVEAVLTADQVKRLHEIQIQLAGDQAISMKNVQTELNLNADQIKKIDELMNAFRAANQSIQEKSRNNEIDSATAQSDRAKNLQTLKENLGKILTPDQSAKLKEMGGRPFQAEATPSS